MCPLPPQSHTEDLADCYTDSIGGFIQQYEVVPDFDKLIALNLTFQDIIEALKKNNVSAGPGYFDCEADFCESMYN